MSRGAQDVPQGAAAVRPQARKPRRASIRRGQAARHSSQCAGTRISRADPFCTQRSARGFQPADPSDPSRDSVLLHGSLHVLQLRACQVTWRTVVLSGSASTERCDARNRPERGTSGTGGTLGRAASSDRRLQLVVWRFDGDLHRDRHRPFRDRRRRIVARAGQSRQHLRECDSPRRGGPLRRRSLRLGAPGRRSSHTSFP